METILIEIIPLAVAITAAVASIIVAMIKKVNPKEKKRLECNHNPTEKPMEILKVEKVHRDNIENILREIRNLIRIKFDLLDVESSGTLCYSLDGDENNWEGIFTNKIPMNEEKILLGIKESNEVANKIMLNKGVDSEIGEYRKNTTFSRYMLKNVHDKEKFLFLRDVFEEGVKCGIYKRIEMDFKMNPNSEKSKWGSIAGYFFILDNEYNPTSSILGMLAIASFGKPMDNGFSREEAEKFLQDTIHSSLGKLNRELIRLYKLKESISST
ncbi:MAG: hypothetical protein FWB80_10965 [Defluviitaleaceae bacterium]|nr:hypothetical protein [Defluviitaleaceae bacterium]